MTLPLPSLDDRTFADLVEEARGLIRTYDPAWTNHNPSDPGITLLELFAWLAEMLLYRSDQVPDRHLVTFLRLLNGPEWEPPRDRPLDEAVRATVLGLRGRYRAVTAADYEALAREASADVARARCVARRYLGGGTEEERLVPRPGHVSVIVLVRGGRSEEVVCRVR